jgi:hypothetical protein
LFVITFDHKFDVFYLHSTTTPETHSPLPPTSLSSFPPTKVVKYFKYCDRALALVIDLLQKPQTQPQLRKLSEAQLAQAVSAKTCEELWQAVGRDFWVVTPCHCISGNGDDGSGGGGGGGSGGGGGVGGGGVGGGGGGSGARQVMEGTRLMLTRAETVAPGYQFTIHTPGTPARWRQYDEELEALFTRLQEVAFGADGGSYSGASASVGASGDTPDGVAGGVSGGDPTDTSGGAVGVEAGSEEEVLVELAMTFFFYWVNFGPLSRGSAATGYAVRHFY